MPNFDATAVINEMRKTMSRNAITKLTGLTGAKIYSIERGRALKPGEGDAIYAAAVELGLLSADVTVVEQSPVTDSEPLTERVVPTIATEPLLTKPTASEPPEPSESLKPMTSAVSVIESPQSSQPSQPSPTALSLMDGFKRYSNSEVYAFKRCPRMWFRTWHQGWGLQVEDPTGPRAIGDRVHRALKQLYAPVDMPRVDPRDALERLIVEDWTAVSAVHNGDVNPILAKKFQEDSDLERIMVEGYVEWLEETGADNEYTVVQPEMYVEAELSEVPGVKIIAKLDARVLRTHDKARLILEHKTCASFQQLTRTLVLDEQTQYQLLIESLQPNLSRSVGTLYNMMRRTKRTPRAAPPFYLRTEIHRSKIELDNFRKRLVGTIRRIEEVRHALDDGADFQEVAYPTPTRDCPWQCDLFNICSMHDDGSRVDAALESLYQIGDPYSYYAK